MATSTVRTLCVLAVCLGASAQWGHFGHFGHAGLHARGGLGGFGHFGDYGQEYIDPNGAGKVVSFDFDGTLHTSPTPEFIGAPMWDTINKLKRYYNYGYTVVITTARREEDNPEVWRFLDQHGIGHMVTRVLNAQNKAFILGALGVVKHYDDRGSNLDDIAMWNPDIELAYEDGSSYQPGLLQKLMQVQLQQAANPQPEPQGQARTAEPAADNKGGGLLGNLFGNNQATPTPAPTVYQPRTDEQDIAEMSAIFGGTDGVGQNRALYLNTPPAVQNIYVPQPAPAPEPAADNSHNDLVMQLMMMNMIGPMMQDPNYIDPNGAGKTVSFDFDGTLHTNPQPDYIGAPKWDMIEKVRQYAAYGYNVIITTARNEIDNPEVWAFLQQVGIAPYISRIYNAGQKGFVLNALGVVKHYDDRGSNLDDIFMWAPGVQVAYEDGSFHRPSLVTALVSSQMQASQIQQAQQQQGARTQQLLTNQLVGNAVANQVVQPGPYHGQARAANLAATVANDLTVRQDQQAQQQQQQQQLQQLVQVKLMQKLMNRG